MFSRHSILLIGDPKTGKTQSIKTLLNDDHDVSSTINSYISLYNREIKLEKNHSKNKIDKINLTIWDCSGEIRDLNYFILINHVSTCLIFCNLLNSNSCDRLDHWKEVIRKKHKYTQIVIVGTCLFGEQNMSERQMRTIQTNKIKVLEWCVENNDTPFFEIDLSNEDEIKEMYNSIFLDRVQKIINLENIEKD